MPKYRDAPKSEMDSQRELLDSLMGINRNKDREEDQISDYRDDRVCKFFLVGMCPNDIFVNTKMDEGPCQKIHSETLKADFQRSRDTHMFDAQIEREFNHRIGEAERVIKKARARVEEEKTDETINPEINPDILRIHADMSRVIGAAEAAGEEGNIDTVQELIYIKLEELHKEKNAVLAKIMEIKRNRPGGPDKKLRVCDVCGSYLSIFDSDKRLQDHFLGKQHIGYQYMRDTVDAIKQRRESSRGGDASGYRRGTHSSSRGRDPRDSNRDARDGRDNRNPSGGGQDRRDRSRNRDSRDRGRDGYSRGGYGARDNSRDRDNRDRDYDRTRGARGSGGGDSGYGNRDRRW